MTFSKSALLVLLALMCERAAYFTVENYVNELWVVKLSYTAGHAVIAHMMFVGASHCFGILGGAFADAFFHPLPMLGIGYILLNIGLVLLESAGSAAETNLVPSRNIAIAGLVIAALGQGCIEVVLPVLGAAQVTDKKESQAIYSLVLRMEKRRGHHR
ncbi:uncharacterized protein LOC106175019 [Lingula anatina]|uniref:Uncharacterized protein LOC106175019 n=1 Tax=Lingula anatina TaxID=7574 RepID=A0A2R2MQZ6_LINAN|nr:uncharacterized protein LOC106175019 [Lingula anatina]|eukprot:XP_023932679.1 uncharacterized protein LOC106175019 [Lingula anatina]